MSKSPQLDDLSLEEQKAWLRQWFLQRRPPPLPDGVIRFDKKAAIKARADRLAARDMVDCSWPTGTSSWDRTLRLNKLIRLCEEYGRFEAPLKDWPLPPRVLPFRRPEK